MRPKTDRVKEECRLGGVVEGCDLSPAGEFSFFILFIVFHCLSVDVFCCLLRTPTTDIQQNIATTCFLNVQVYEYMNI